MSRHNSNMSVSSKSFIRNLLGFSISTWISFAISFITVPIVTRLFIPEEMGKINLFFTIVNFGVLLLSLGLDQAYVRYYNEPPRGEETKVLIMISLKIISGVWVIALVSAILFADKISVFIVGEKNHIIIILLMFNILANIVLRFLNLTYRMQVNIRKFTVQSILIVIIGKLSYAFAALWSAKYENAIFINTLLIMVLLMIYILIQRGMFDFKIGINENNITSRIMLKYSLPLIPMIILTFLNSSLSTVLLRKFFSFKAVGIFTSALTISSLINLIQAGFNSYWCSYVYANYKTEQQRIQNINRYLTFAITLLAVCIVSFQDIIFLIVGKSYFEAKLFFPFLIVAPVCYTISETTGFGVNLVSKTYLHIITSALTLLANIIAFICLIRFFGISGAAMASATSGIVYLIVKTYLGEKYYKCIKNFGSIYFTISVILLMAIVNFVLFNSISKYIIFACISFITFIYFRNEISSIKSLIMSIPRKK